MIAIFLQYFYEIDSTRLRELLNFLIKNCFFRSSKFHEQQSVGALSALPIHQDVSDQIKNGRSGFIFIWLVLINRNYSQTVRITILEAAMAPMITSNIVAIRSGLNPELSALMLGVGIPLSLVTVPLFDFLLRNFGLN
jgi:hypothetical protein